MVIKIIIERTVLLSHKKTDTKPLHVDAAPYLYGAVSSER
jgi:hypothetical protein